MSNFNNGAILNFGITLKPTTALIMAKSVTVQYVINVIIFKCKTNGNEIVSVNGKPKEFSK